MVRDVIREGLLVVIVDDDDVVVVVIIIGLGLSPWDRSAPISAVTILTTTAMFSPAPTAGVPLSRGTRYFRASTRYKLTARHIRVTN